MDFPLFTKQLFGGMTKFATITRRNKVHIQLDFLTIWNPFFIVIKMAAQPTNHKLVHIFTTNCMITNTFSVSWHNKRIKQQRATNIHVVLPK